MINTNSAYWKPSFFFILTLLLLQIITPSALRVELNTDLASTNQNTVKPDLMDLNSHLTKSFQGARHSNATNWIPFIDGALPGTPSEVYVQSSDHTRIVVAAKFYGMWTGNNNRIESNIYSIHDVPGCGHFSDLGDPELPFITRFVEIPYRVNVQIEVLDKTPISFSGYNVTPFRDYFPSTSGSGNTSIPWTPPPTNITQPPINSSVYTYNYFYPTYDASLTGGLESEAIYFRGHRILALNIVPIQFHPQNKELKAYSRMVIALNFDKQASLPPIDLRVVSPTIKTLLSSFLLNFDVISRPITNPHYRTTKSHQSSTGADYLIITANQFVYELQPLVNWKRMKGLQTELWTVDTIIEDETLVDSQITDEEEYNRTAISNFIKRVYKRWTPIPTYILFVGDDEHIPPHYGMVHYDPVHYNAKVGTDLLYFTVNGTDYVPEFLFGRLSVDSPDQASAFVTKILSYERTPPPADSNFYSCVSPVSFDYPYDPARSFFQSAGNVSLHFENLHYNIEPVYTSWPLVQNPTDVKIYIRNNISDGRLLVYYVGHGESQNFVRPDQRHLKDGWSNPVFTIADLEGLSNENMYPLVISIACNVGWFDGTTDSDSGPYPYLLDREHECFSEIITRLEDSGAIAAVGASRIAEFVGGDSMFDGMIDALWPDLDPSFTFGGTPTLGEMMWYGKMFAASHFGFDAKRTKLTFQTYHLFGDPEMTIWTGPPHNLDVEHPTGIGSGGLQSFYVKVVNDSSGEPVQSAKVCLKDGTQLYVNNTNSYGYAYFYVVPETGGRINITVTHPKFLPFSNTIFVTDNGAEISFTHNHEGDAFDLTFHGKNFNPGVINIDFSGSQIIGVVDLDSNGQFNTPANIPSDVTSPVNIIANQENGDLLAVVLFGRLDDHPDPYIYCQWDAGTWTSHPDPSGTHPRWDNPDIQLRYAIPLGTYDMDKEATYTIDVTVHNAAPVDAHGTIVTLFWSPWGIGQTSWTPLHEWNDVYIPGKGATTKSTAWKPANSNVCLLVNISHEMDAFPENNIGMENLAIFQFTDPGENIGTLTFTLFNSEQENIGLYVNDLEGTDLLEKQIVTLERQGTYTMSPPPIESVDVWCKLLAEVNWGETRNYVVTGKVDNEVIGGIEIILFKTIITIKPISINWFILLLVLVILIVIVIVAAILYLRK